MRKEQLLVQLLQLADGTVRYDGYIRGDVSMRLPTAAFGGDGRT